MTQIAYSKIGSDWVDVTTLGTFTQDGVYYIQNRGSGLLIAVESATEPATEAGISVLPHKVLKYTYTEKLWVKAYGGTCSINISEA